MQILGAVRRAAALENRAEWSRAAFVGWQGYLMQPVRGRRTPFGEWLVDFGIVPKRAKHLQAVDAKAEVQRAMANAQRVLAAFDRGVPREVASG